MTAGESRLPGKIAIEQKVKQFATEITWESPPRDLCNSPVSMFMYGGGTGTQQAPAKRRSSGSYLDTEE